MTLPKNLFGFNLSKRCICLFIALCFALTAYSQEVSKTEEWWVPITQKHDIKYDSYTLLGEFFIIGEKSVDGEIEIFKNVTLIGEAPEYYYIFRAKTASYDPLTTTLEINNCTREKFKKDSKSLEPVESWEHIDYSANFETYVHTMTVVRQ
jgi:hypothetical protein